MRPLVASPAWTPEEDELLLALALSGTSVAAMAKRLRRSRSAVYGRASRLKIVLAKSRRVKVRGKLTPDHFLGEIVTGNVLQLSENRGNMTCAVNALLTLDAFTGILFAHLANLKRSPFKDDIEFRDVLCHECSEFRIVRDAAFALKHGELTAKKPRLVQRADRAFDQAVFDRSVFDAGSVIWIETTDPSGSTPADVAALAVLNYFQTLISRFENSPG